MTNWEYAAIVKDGTTGFEGHNLERWCLMKPGNEPHLISHIRQAGGPYRKEHFLQSAWRSPTNAKMLHDEVEERKVINAAMQQKPVLHKKINDSAPVILFEATDLLTLVNMAGKDGWEITGGLGLADGEPGRFESKWRIMRKVL